MAKELTTKKERYNLMRLQSNLIHLRILITLFFNSAVTGLITLGLIILALVIEKMPFLLSLMRTTHYGAE